MQKIHEKNKKKKAGNSFPALFSYLKINKLIALWVDFVGCFGL
jgi:hypothetical protein